MASSTPYAITALTLLYAGFTPPKEDAVVKKFLNI